MILIVVVFIGIYIPLHYGSFGDMFKAIDKMPSFLTFSETGLNIPGIFPQYSYLYAYFCWPLYGRSAYRKR